MHLFDTLISPAVAAVTGIGSATLLGIAATRLCRNLDTLHRERIIPLMGVMGAFIFAVQLLNFAIPGTGSSGHIIGGIMLSAILGPWAAFITLSSVIVLQSLLFADGGLLAMGANIINMAAMSCLVAYPLLFRPLMRRHARRSRIFAVSIAASVAALAAGAAAVVIETELSGITALPTGRFLSFMLPIHLAVGLGEGIATGAVLSMVQRWHPELILGGPTPARRCSWGGVLALVAGTALLLGATFRHLASNHPDGLEWSVIRSATAEPAAIAGTLNHRAAEMQQSMAIAPDYETSLAGIIGCGAILLFTAGASHLYRSWLRRD